MSFRRFTPQYSEGALLDERTTAFSAAAYSFCASMLVVLIYSWRIGIVSAKLQPHGDIYYGVQISYGATVASHLILMTLSAFLLVGITKECESLVALWVVGKISLMAFEGLCCVYSNVLRDHINKKFDHFSKIEGIFFCSRLVIGIVALWGVLRFYRKIKDGISFKGPEIFEL